MGAPRPCLYKHTLCLETNLAQSISHIANFPKDPSPSGLALFGKLGNGKWLEVQISQVPHFPKDPSPDGPALFGKLGNGWRYRFPNFPISQKISAHLAQHDLGIWEMVTSIYFPISKIIPAQMAQPYLGNLEIGKPKP